MFPELGQAYFEGNSHVLATGITEEVQDTFIQADGTRVPVLTRTGRGDGSGWSALHRRVHHRPFSAAGGTEEAGSGAAGVGSAPGATAQPDGLASSRITSCSTRISDLVRQSGGRGDDRVRPPLSLIGMGYREFLLRTWDAAVPAFRAKSLMSVVDYRIEQVVSLEEGPLIEVKTPSAGALAGGSRRLDGGRILLNYSDVSDVIQREEETLLYRAALEQMRCRCSFAIPIAG